MGDADSLQRLPEGFAGPLETPQLLMAHTGWDYALAGACGVQGDMVGQGGAGLPLDVLGLICSTLALLCLYKLPLCAAKARICTPSPSYFQFSHLDSLSHSFEYLDNIFFLPPWVRPCLSGLLLFLWARNLDLPPSS